MVLKKIITCLLISSLQLWCMEDNLVRTESDRASCSIALARQNTVQESGHEIGRLHKSDFLSSDSTESVVESLSQELEKQLRSLPTDLGDKIEQAEQVLQQVNVGKTYFSDLQLQQSKNILSECQTAVADYLAQRISTTLAIPTYLYAVQMATDLTPLKKLLEVISPMINDIESTLAINMALNQAALDIFVESQKNKSLYEIGMGAISLYGAQKQSYEQRSALQAEINILKDAAKKSLTMAKICSGGKTPDCVNELIYNQTEFVRTCKNIFERTAFSNGQNINSFIQDAMAKAAEIRQHEEIISQLSKNIELLDLKIATGAQFYVQRLKEEAAILGTKSMHDLQQLRDDVYKVGMTANNLVEQFDQTCKNLHIKMSQHAQYNAILNLVTICDKSKEMFDKISHIAETHGQKLLDLPEIPKLADLAAQINPVTDCDAVLQKVDSLAVNLQSKTFPELQTLQKQVYDIGMNADGHIAKIAVACTKANQEMNTPSRTPFVYNLLVIFKKCKRIYDQIDTILKSVLFTATSADSNQGCAAAIIAPATSQPKAAEQPSPAATTKLPAQQKVQTDQKPIEKAASVLQAQQLETEIFKEAQQKFCAAIAQQQTQCKTVESKVDFAFKLIAQRAELDQKGAPRPLIDACNDALHKCTQNINESLAAKFTNRPNFLETEHWDQLNATCSSVRKLINKVDEPHQAYKASLETLYKARLFFKNFARQINDMTEMGSDFTGKSTSETAPIQAGLKDYNAVVNTCIICLEQKMGAYSAARFIQTEQRLHACQLQMMPKYGTSMLQMQETL